MSLSLALSLCQSSLLSFSFRLSETSLVLCFLFFVFTPPFICVFCVPEFLERHQSRVEMCHHRSVLCFTFRISPTLMVLGMCLAPSLYLHVYPTHLQCVCSIRTMLCPTVLFQSPCWFFFLSFPLVNKKRQLFPFLSLVRSLPPNSAFLFLFLH